MSVMLHTPIHTKFIGIFFCRQQYINTLPPGAFYPYLYDTSERVKA